MLNISIAAERQYMPAGMEVDQAEQWQDLIICFSWASGLLPVTLPCSHEGSCT